MYDPTTHRYSYAPTVDDLAPDYYGQAAADVIAALTAEYAARRLTYFYTQSNATWEVLISATGERLSLKEWAARYYTASRQYDARYPESYQGEAYQDD
jgi:hypothetical protein